MTLKVFVDSFNRREEKRRQLAELRVTYGNALSDTNRSRSQQQSQRSQDNPAKNFPTWDHKSNSQFSNRNWQLSNNSYSSGKNRTRTDLVLARRYNILQRQARLQSNFMNHVMKVNAGKVIALINKQENYLY